MVQFKVNQWVKIVEHDQDDQLRGQKAFVFWVNDDGSGRARLNRQPGVIVTVWPEQCEVAGR